MNCSKCNKECDELTPYHIEHSNPYMYDGPFFEPEFIEVCEECFDKLEVQRQAENTSNVERYALYGLLIALIIVFGLIYVFDTYIGRLTPKP